MSPDQQWKEFMPKMAKHISDQEIQNKKLDEIYSAVIGNEKLKQKGLFERVNTLEEKDKKKEIRQAFFWGGSVAAALGLNKLIDFLSKF